MKGADGLILWVLGGAGVLFLYAAYKNRSPQDVLTGYLSPGTRVEKRSDLKLGPDNKPFSGAGTGFTADSQFVYDGDGNPIAAVPAGYRDSPNTYTGAI